MQDHLRAGIENDQLRATGAFIVVTTALIWFIEHNNPRTLQALGIGEALLASYFQAVTPRTAGFNTLDIGAMQHASLFLLVLLMFIGAAPGGTGGGGPGGAAGPGLAACPGFAS